MVPLFAFQEIEAPKTFRLDFELMMLLLGLMILVVLGAAIAMRMRGLARSNDDEPPVVEHSLEHYQQLFEQGVIDAEEFQRIAANFGKKTSGRNPSPPTDP